MGRISIQKLQVLLTQSYLYFYVILSKQFLQVFKMTISRNVAVILVNKILSHPSSNKFILPVLKNLFIYIYLHIPCCPVTIFNSLVNKISFFVFI